MPSSHWIEPWHDINQHGQRTFCKHGTHLKKQIARIRGQLTRYNMKNNSPLHVDVVGFFTCPTWHPLYRSPHVRKAMRHSRSKIRRLAVQRWLSNEFND